MKYRNLGNLKVSAVGYGCMGLSHGYGLTPEKDRAIRLTHLSRAARFSIRQKDTASVKTRNSWEKPSEALGIRS